MAKSKKEPKINTVDVERNQLMLLISAGENPENKILQKEAKRILAQHNTKVPEEITITVEPEKSTGEPIEVKSNQKIPKKSFTKNLFAVINNTVESDLPQFSDSRK